MRIVNTTYHGDSKLWPMIDPDALIKARKAADLSQPQLANRVGCSQQLIGALETGTTRTTKFLPRIAAVLSVPPGDLDSDWADVQPPKLDPIPEARLMSATRDFPIYSAAEGGPGEIIRSPEPVDWVPRPAPVANVKNAYGLHIVGESMAPEFEPGDVALINPALPLIGNTTCIFYAERDGEARATVKRLRRASSDKWLVQQWNPPKDFTLSRKEWGICHRALGKYYRQ